jgi:hypothetical protein
MFCVNAPSYNCMLGYSEIRPGSRDRLHEMLADSIAVEEAQDLEARTLVVKKGLKEGTEIRSS